ncbi:hypothetical protein [Neomicrococcus aestuarii]|uniref:Acetone carboxylase n=1 Tax=Neomicrococcus aestuarii TaxID=556325 RepID=A0A1L2ZMC0_9MICC|nr:hypothetical protein [Neomicrococcus aestuarii]APF40171.1 hypothetical protein BHE16_03050 [Neomicrococcus aestuarii]MBB5511839.1 hypothetical protein [Neomicrococcus aestuarii]
MSSFDILGSLGAPSAAPEKCSRKGCRAAASYQILWNNPKIHTPERRKVWLACAEHQEWLAEYLRQRGMLKEVVPFDAPHVTEGNQS